MIKTIINALNDKLVFSNKNGLAELITKNEVQRPMVYTSGGEWKEIQFENESTSYWRKLGVEQTPVESITGCVTDIERIYRLKLVVIVDRKELDCDDQYADDRVADEVISKLTGVDVALKKAIRARQANVFVTSYTTDNSTIEAIEYTGVQMRHKFVYLSLDVEVEVVVTPQCIELCP